MFSRLIYFFLFVGFVSCSSPSDYVFHWKYNDKGRDRYYKNVDHNFEIHLRTYWDWEGNKSKLKNYEIYDKHLKLQNTYPGRIEFLQYVKDMMTSQDAFFAELYQKKPKLSYAIKDLKKRKFINFEIIDSTTNHLYYEKKINEHTYHIEEKFKQVGNKAIRLVFFTINPYYLIYTEPEVDVPLEVIKKNLRRDINYTYSKVDTSTVDSIYNKNYKNNYIKMLTHFRNYYKFDYAKLNVALDSILNSDEEYNSSSVNTLLSYLSRNQDIYKENIKRKSRKDSLNLLLKENSVISVDDFLTTEELPQLLIINESHIWTQNRWQLTKMLPKLKEKGYNSLFVETLFNSDEILREFDLDQYKGNYTSDPTFGNLLVKADSLGMNIYAYEMKAPEDPKENESRLEMRERIQAENIIHRIRENRLFEDGGKAIVYCGFDHANEIGLKYNGKLSKTLARNLKDSLKIDPLTINQYAAIGREDEIAKQLDLEQNKPYFISSPRIKKRGYDYYLVEDNPNYFENYPDYIYEVGDIPWEIQCNNLEMSDDYFIWIESNLHYKHKIPYFVAPYRFNKPTIKLPKGEHRIFVFDKDILICEEYFIIK